MRFLRRNAISNVAGRLATAVLWIVATPYVLHKLGAEGFGIWSLFFAFNAYLLRLDFGIGSTMLRYVAAQRAGGHRRDIARTIRWGWWASLGMGMVWAAAIEISRGWIATAFHVPEPMMSEALSAMVVFGAGVLVMFPAQALTASLQGFERIDHSNLCVVLGVVVHVLMLYVNLSGGAGLVGAAWAGAIGQAVTALTAATLLWLELRKVPHQGAGKAPTWREMLHFSLALQVLGALIVLQIQSGRIVLGLLGNLKLVADYELAFRVAYTLAGLPILIRDPVMPTVSRLWEEGGVDSVRPLFKTTSLWVFKSSVITLGLLWLLASDIAMVWLGPGNERIADLMRLWVLANAANLAYAPGVAIARGMGMPRFEILSYAAALAMNIGLAIAWVPAYGAAGAVAATLVSYGVGFIVFIIAFHSRLTAFPFWSWWWRDLLPRAAVGFLAVASTRWLLATKPLAGLLPSPGWSHAMVGGGLFLAIFALFFLPLGDTQRLTRGIWQMTAGLGVRRREAPTPTT